MSGESRTSSDVRMSRTISAVEVAEAGVVVMVVDVHDQPGSVDHVHLGPDAPLARAVEREENSLRRVVRQRPPEPAQVEEAILGRRRRLAGQVHDDVLAERSEGDRHREHRSERVAVGVLVRRQEERIVRPDRLGDRTDVTVCRRLARHRGLAGRPRARRSAWSCGRRARPRHRRRTSGAASFAAGAPG